MGKLQPGTAQADGSSTCKHGDRILMSRKHLMKLVNGMRSCEKKLGLQVRVCSAKKSLKLRTSSSFPFCFGRTVQSRHGRRRCGQRNIKKPDSGPDTLEPGKGDSKEATAERRLEHPPESPLICDGLFLRTIVSVCWTRDQKNGASASRTARTCHANAAKMANPNQPTANLSSNISESMKRRSSVSNT